MPKGYGRAAGNVRDWNRFHMSAGNLQCSEAFQGCIAYEYTCRTSACQAWPSGLPEFESSI
jgi:hypothetical protein